jgi:hypothetical protein
MHNSMGRGQAIRKCADVESLQLRATSRPAGSSTKCTACPRLCANAARQPPPYPSVHSGRRGHISPYAVQPRLSATTWTFMLQNQTVLTIIKEVHRSYHGTQCASLRAPGHFPLHSIGCLYRTHLSKASRSPLKRWSGTPHSVTPGASTGKLTLLLNLLLPAGVLGTLLPLG